jgi:hypothetical protein
MVFKHQNTYFKQINADQCLWAQEVSANTSADTANASNQCSHLRACNKGLRRVSKFETTASFIPALLSASNTFPASGSQICQAYKITSYDSLNRNEIMFMSTNDPRMVDGT